MADTITNDGDIQIVSKDDAVAPTLEKLSKNAKKWRALSYSAKLEYLKTMKSNLISVTDQISLASDEVRKYNDTYLQGTGGLLSVALLAPHLRGLIELYESLVKTGNPPEPASKRKVKDIEVAKTFPRKGTLWDKITEPVDVELWSEPGKKLASKGLRAPKTDEKNEEEDDGESGVCFVMNGGNFESPIDVLHQMFIEGKVVMTKAHPNNEKSMKLILQKVMTPLVRDGYLAVAAGGPEISKKILNDTNTNTWMMTGGCATYDAIVWGPAAERDQKKKLGQKTLDKPCHSELGACSPWIIFPGDWSTSEITTQVKLFLGCKVFNGGAVCASPQIIVLDRSWKLAKNFIAEMKSQLQELTVVPPYYPGTQDRLDAMRKNCPATEVFEKSNMHVIFDLDDANSGGDYFIRNEIFGPGFGIKYVDSGNDKSKFIEQVLVVANDKIFGSLSCSVMVDSKTLSELKPKFEEEFLYNLQWGTIGINVWATYMVQIPYGRWGAPPNRHTEVDIQSGIGGQGNCLLLDNVYKGVLWSGWCDPVLTPMLQTPNSSTGNLNNSYTKLRANQSFGALAQLGLSIGKSMFASTPKKEKSSTEVKKEKKQQPAKEKVAREEEEQNEKQE